MYKSIGVFPRYPLDLQEEGNNVKLYVDKIYGMFF